MKTYWQKDKGKAGLEIKDVEYRGHKPYCAIHDKTAYSDKHDAFYCADCNRWLGEKCDDPDCEFCKDRPEKPLNKRIK